MKRGILALSILIFCASPAALARFEEEKLVQEYARKLAKERDPRERAAAARWLGGRAHPEAVGALAKALSDPDASVREAAASGLWDTGEKAAAAKPELTKALGDPEAAVVARGAGALHAMDVPQKELADAWRRALAGARDDATAFLSARGLIGIEPAEKLAPPILTFLAKKAEDAARETRGRSNYDDKKSAENAEKALQRLLEKDAASLLPSLGATIAKSPNSGRYVLSALASVKTLPKGTVELALAHTRSPLADTRYTAIKLAGKVTAEREAAKWIPEAIHLLGDPDEGVRMEACWALKGIKGLAHEAAPELVRLLTKDSPKVRERAADTLGEIGDVNNPAPKAAKIAVAAAAKDALAAAMKEREHDLAVEAVSAYNVLYIENSEMIATLADAAVNGADLAARQKALQALRNRQGQSRPVVEKIRPLTRSSEKYLADDAKAAIEWIERGGSGSPAAIHAGASPPSERAAAKSSAAPPAAEPSSKEPASTGNEQRGLAVLREKNLELNEPSFYRALSKAELELVKAYLDAGMSPKHVFTNENRRTPLMILFFSSGCSEPEKGRAVAKLLLDRGADVNAADEKKNTALMFAAGTCDRQTLRMLLKAGAKLNARNWANLTALEGGIVTGNPGLEELIDAGARLDPEKAKSWSEAYKNNPKALALIKKASAKGSGGQ